MGSLRSIQREASVLNNVLRKPQHWYGEGYGLVELNTWWYWNNGETGYFAWHFAECSTLRWAMNQYVTSMWVTYSFSSWTPASGACGYFDRRKYAREPIDFYVWQEKKARIKQIYLTAFYTDTTSRGPPTHYLL